MNGGPAFTQLAAQGHGAGLLSCIEGDALPGLTRLSGDEPLILREIWMLVLPELRRNDTVKCVLDWLVEVTERDGAALHGARASKAAAGG